MQFSPNRQSSRTQSPLKTFGYDRPVGKAIYAIDAFPDDAQLWRID
jgi:hypothetical protein